MALTLVFSLGLPTVFPARHANATIVQRPGLNVGFLRTSTDDKPTVASGVLADPDFAFIPKAVIDLFDKKKWASHVSLRYLTDAYCRQTDKHSLLKDTVAFDSESRSFVTSSTELPDMSEDTLSFLEWTRAFQRLLAILRALNHPRVFYWEAHEHLVKHHSALTTNWPLLLAYDIHIRRRSVVDSSLDVSIFQQRIFDSLRPAFDKRSNEDFMRGLWASDPARRTISAAPESSRSRDTRNPVGASQPHRAQTRHVTAGTIRCFICGGTAHPHAGCSATATVSGKSILVSKSTDGKNWLINGKEFCYRFNGSRSCNYAMCSRPHLCSLCGSQSHSAQGCSI
jgi:hypothetical protein